ncbi:MAG: phosphotransferase [Myxococcota bacterium]|nr:phosphotransferase [Myxococcota bacterium]
MQHRSVVPWLELASKLAQQALWLSRDRLFASRLAVRDGIPTRVEDIDPAWLGEALSSDFPGLEVTSCRLEGGHSGTTTRERIGFDVAGPSRPADLPEHLFIKITPVSLGTKVFAGLFGLGRSEVRFYDEIARDVPIAIPRHFCARSAAHGGRFILLLEDLAARGCRFPSGDLDADEARAVIRALGRLHAAFWESPRFASDLSWLRCHENRNNIAVESWMSARANQPSLDRYPDDVTETAKSRSHDVHRHRERLEAYWSDGPRSLIHGDCHMGNSFFDGDEAGYFDWQVVQQGQGIRDVSYFMTNSLTTELRRRHEDELLSLYLDTLRDAGVEGEGVDPEWTLERYRAHTLYVWISSSVTAATPGLQPREVARAAMQRTTAAMDDHKAFDLLDEIIAR